MVALTCRAVLLSVAAHICVMIEGYYGTPLPRLDWKGGVGAHLFGRVAVACHGSLQPLLRCGYVSCGSVADLILHCHCCTHIDEAVLCGIEKLTERMGMHIQRYQLCRLYEVVLWVHCCLLACCLHPVYDIAVGVHAV